MRVRKTVVTLWLLWIGGVLLTIAAPGVLPERYYFDANWIRELLADRWTVGSESFVSTANAYRFLGFPALWPDALVGPLSFTLAFVAVAVGARLARAPWRPPVFVLLAAWMVPIAIFHGTYSKEVFAIVAIAAILRLAKSPGGVVAGTAIALLYAAGFRNYWVVIVVLWLTLLGGWRIGLGWSGRLALAALVILPLSLASEELAGLWLTDGRTVVVEAREGDPDSATMFVNRLVNESPLTDLLNTTLGWVTLVLPVYLLLLGAAQHVAFALFQFLNTAVFVQLARRLPRPLPGGRPNVESWRGAAAVTWCVAYSIVQGMFEPDFGSFVKHEANLVPMLLYLLAHRRWRNDAAEFAKSSVTPPDPGRAYPTAH